MRYPSPNFTQKTNQVVSPNSADVVGGKEGGVWGKSGCSHAFTHVVTSPVSQGDNMEGDTSTS